MTQITRLHGYVKEEIHKLDKTVEAVMVKVVTMRRVTVTSNRKRPGFGLAELRK